MILEKHYVAWTLLLPMLAAVVVLETFGVKYTNVYICRVDGSVHRDATWFLEFRPLQVRLLIYQSKKRTTTTGVSRFLREFGPSSQEEPDLRHTAHYYKGSPIFGLISYSVNYGRSMLFGNGMLILHNDQEAIYEFFVAEHARDPNFVFILQNFYSNLPEHSRDLDEQFIHDLNVRFIEWLKETKNASSEMEVPGSLRSLTALFQFP